MKVIVMIHANDKSEAGEMPSEQVFAEMGKFNDELIAAKVMLSGEGLHPSSNAKRVVCTRGQVSVIDGPFTESKELIAGYWTWQVESLDEAVDWVKRIPNPDHEDWEIDIRVIGEMEDLGETFTPELREQEERQRAELVRRAESTAPSAPAAPRMIFVNMPVADLARSTAFFTKLGYTFNAQFTNEDATCMVISDTIYAMLLLPAFFNTFTPKQIADTSTTCEMMVALSADSREDVDRIVETALAAGATPSHQTQDYGFMYSRGFHDLDGHIWEYVWMDPAHVQG